MAVRLPRPVRLALVAFVVVFAGMQLVQPDRTNPAVDPSHSLLTKAPPDVRAILERSCRDCHTHETTWPVYSYVAPMSWFVANHVHHGRDRVNFSEWTAIDPDDQDKFFGGICSQPKRGRMPLPSYLYLHRDAKLSTSDVAALCAWSEKMRDTLQ
jgi:hypothetical protein